MLATAYTIAEYCRRLERGYLFGFCLASGRAVWQHKDAYASLAALAPSGDAPRARL